MKFGEMQTCKGCGGRFSIETTLRLASFYWYEVDALVCLRPCCQATVEIRVGNGKVEDGYVYGAGSAHFCGVDEYLVTGLRVDKNEKGIRYSLPDKPGIFVENRQIS
jgi:hypothetical protein